MSTRRTPAQPDLQAAGPAPARRRRRRDRGLRRLGLLDPLESVALVICERREPLLAKHAQRLGREELEDCYSQATVELLLRAGRPERFASVEHIANALEQRLCSRIVDRQRALAGRSPIEAAIARALPLAACEGGRGGLIDERADVERIAVLREELDRIARFSRELTRDQRLLLAGELCARQSPGEFCVEHGWSLEKYRKVSQRARARLTRLLAADLAVPVSGERRISRQDPPMQSTRPPHRHVPRDAKDRPIGDRYPIRGTQSDLRSASKRSPGDPSDRRSKRSAVDQRGRDRERESPPARLPVVRAPRRRPDAGRRR